MCMVLLVEGWLGMKEQRQEDVPDTFGDICCLPLPSVLLTDNQYGFCNIPLDMKPHRGPLPSTNPTLIYHPVAKLGKILVKREHKTTFHPILPTRILKFIV